MNTCPAILDNPTPFQMLGWSEFESGILKDAAPPLMQRRLASERTPRLCGRFHK